MSIPARPKDPDRLYEHRFHAGNSGDVLKHVALLALLERLPATAVYVETHAGAGRYRLGPTGEWREGVGKLLERPRDAMPLAVRRYLDAVVGGVGGRVGDGVGDRVGEEVDPRRGLDYPGSPLLAARRLGPQARLRLYELFEAPQRQLSALFGGDPRVEVRAADGMAALAAGLGGDPGDDLGEAAPALVLVDPPFHDKAEWTALPRALAAASRARPRAVLCAWYPIKAHTRPNAMLASLAAAGVAGAACELITAPLAQRKNRLAGSGVVLVRPPEGLLEELAAICAWLGPALCLHAGEWSTRTQSWSDRSERASAD